MSDLLIRRFRPEDRGVLHALNAYGLAAAGIACDEDHYQGQDLTDLERTYAESAGGALLVGEVHQAIVAMGGIRRVDADTCELLRMRVYPQYQGRGYGRAILDALEQEARRHGYRRIDLLTGEHQHPAIDLYTSCNCRVTRRELLIGIPSVHMRKDLDDA